MENGNFSNTAVTSDQLKIELERLKNKPKGSSYFKGVFVGLIAIVAIISFLTTMFFPIINIRGGSMSPTLEEKSLALALKTDELSRGDICVFYSGSNILCKRIIALGGEVIDIDENGVVYIDNVPLDEPYLTATDLGDANINFPYLVPEHTYFVMGDNRSISIDSRNTEIGCVSESQMIGKTVFVFWPIKEIGTVK